MSKTTLFFSLRLKGKMSVRQIGDNLLFFRYSLSFVILFNKIKWIQKLVKFYKILEIKNKNY